MRNSRNTNIINSNNDKNNSNTNNNMIINKNNIGECKDDNN